MNRDRCIEDSVGNIFVAELREGGDLALRMYNSSNEVVTQSGIESNAQNPHVSYDIVENRVYMVFSRDGTGNTKREFVILKFNPEETNPVIWVPEWRYVHRFGLLVDGQFPKVSLPYAQLTQRVEFVIVFVGTDVVEYIGLDGQIVRESRDSIKMSIFRSEDGGFEREIPTNISVNDFSKLSVTTDGQDIFIGCIYNESPLRQNLLRVIKYNGITFARPWVYENATRGSNVQTDFSVKTNLQIIKFGSITFLLYNSNNNLFIHRISNRGLREWPTTTRPVAPISMSGFLGNSIQGAFLFQDVIMISYISAGSFPTTVTFKKISTENGMQLNPVRVTEIDEFASNQILEGKAVIVSTFPWAMMRVIYLEPSTQLNIQRLAIPNSSWYDVNTWSSNSLPSPNSIINFSVGAGTPTLIDHPSVNASCLALNVEAEEQTIEFSNGRILSVGSRGITVAEDSTLTLSGDGFVNMNGSIVIMGNLFITGGMTVSVPTFGTGDPLNIQVIQVNRDIVNANPDIESSEMTREQIVTTPTFDKSFLTYKDIDGIHVSMVTNENEKINIFDNEGVSVPIPETVDRVSPVISYYGGNLYLLSLVYCSALSEFIKVYINQIIESEFIGKNRVFLRFLPQGLNETEIRNLFPTSEFPELDYRNKILSVSFRDEATGLDSVEFETEEFASAAAASIDKIRVRGTRIRTIVGSERFRLVWTAEKIIPDPITAALKPKVFGLENRAISLYHRADQSILIDWFRINGSYRNSFRVTRAPIVDQPLETFLTNDASSIAVSIDPRSLNLIIGASSNVDPSIYVVNRVSIQDFKTLATVETNFNLPSQVKSDYTIQETEMLDGRAYVVCKTSDNNHLVAFVTTENAVNGYRVDWVVNSGLSNLFANRLAAIYRSMDNIILFGIDQTTRELVSAKATTSGFITNQSRAIDGLSNLTTQSFTILSHDNFTQYYVAGYVTGPEGPNMVFYPSVSIGVLYNEIDIIPLVSSLQEMSTYQYDFDHVEKIQYVIGRTNPANPIIVDDTPVKVRQLTSYLNSIDEDFDNLLYETDTFGGENVIDLFKQKLQELDLADVIEMVDVMIEGSLTTPRSINYIEFIVMNFRIQHAGLNLIENINNNYIIQIPFGEYSPIQLLNSIRNRFNRISMRVYSYTYDEISNKASWSYTIPEPTVNNSLTLNQAINVTRLNRPNYGSGPVIQIVYERGVNIPSITFNVDWTDLTILDATLNNIYIQFFISTDIEQRAIRDTVEEEIYRRRLEYFGSLIQDYINSNSQSLREYSYTVNPQLGLINWFYFEREQVFDTPISTHETFTTFPNVEFFITVVLEKIVQFISRRNLTNNIYQYFTRSVRNGISQTSLEWSVRRATSPPSELKTTDETVFLIVGSSDPTVIFDQIRRIINSASIAKYDYAISGQTVTWTIGETTGINTEDLLFNILRYTFVSQEAVFNAIGALFSGDPSIVYSYDFNLTLQKQLRWSFVEVSLVSSVVGTNGTMEEFLVDLNLSPGQRTLLLDYMKTVADETTERFYSYQYDEMTGLVTWTYIIPPSPLIQNGTTELLFENYPYDTNIVKSEFAEFILETLNDSTNTILFDYVSDPYSWSYQNVVISRPMSTQWLFSGADVNTLELVLGLPPKPTTIGNYSVYFNELQAPLEPILDILTDQSGELLTMKLVEDLTNTFEVSVLADESYTLLQILDLIKDEFNTLGSKTYSYTIVDDRVRWKFEGDGAVAFEFDHEDPLSLAPILGFEPTEYNEVFSFDSIIPPNQINIDRVKEPIVEIKPEGLYIKKYTDAGVQSYVDNIRQLDPEQVLLNPHGYNGCICLDEEYVYVSYLVGSKTLTGFIDVYIAKLFRSNLLTVFTRTITLPDNDLDSIFPRIFRLKDEVHLVFTRNDSRVYVNAFDVFTAKPRYSVPLDIGIKVCYPDKREFKVEQSRFSLEDSFYVYMAYPDGTNPYGGSVTLVRYLSSNYSIADPSFWNKSINGVSGIKTDIILKEDPITKELFISFTNRPTLGDPLIRINCVTPEGVVRYVISGLESFENLVNDRLLGMYIFDECLLLFGLTITGTVISYKARTSNGTRVGDIISTPLGYDTSQILTTPFYVDIVSPWNKIYIGYNLVFSPVFTNLIVDILESPSTSGITVTETEVSQYQSHVDSLDNIFTIFYAGPNEGINLTKFSDTGTPLVQRKVTDIGQTPSLVGRGSDEVYLAYTITVDSFVKYLGVQVSRVRTTNLNEVWSYTRLYEEEEPAPFRPRMQLRDDRLYTVYKNNSDDIYIQINRAATGQLVRIINTGIKLQTPSPIELAFELQNENLIYFAIPNNTGGEEDNSIKLIKYNMTNGGSIVWQNDNFEIDVLGEKKHIQLRYNQQLQNEFVSFDLNLDSTLSQAEMAKVFESLGVPDRSEEVWTQYGLTPTQGLIYEQFAEYMYANFFGYLNKNGLYILYTSGLDNVRLAKIDQLSGTTEWRIDTEMSDSYGGRAHAFYITNNVPLVFGIETSTDDMVAKKFTAQEGQLISLTRRHLETFDKNLFLDYPAVISREFWDAIWLIYPKPTGPLYDNWVILVNKLVSPAVPDPSEIFVKLGDKQALNDCDDCLYITYVTQEGPNYVTLSKMTYDGVVRFVKQLDTGGQSPTVNVVDDRVYVSYVKRLVSFTDFVGLYVQCIRTDNFETVWRSERFLDDSFIQYHKPRIQKTDKGVHVVYFRQDRFIYIDTYDPETGVIVDEPLKTNFLAPATDDLEFINEYTNELDTHSTDCYLYIAFPSGEDLQDITMVKFDTTDFSNPWLGPIVSNYGSTASKSGINIETSRDDLYVSDENIYVGFKDGDSNVKFIKFCPDSTVLWNTDVNISFDNIYEKRIHGMYVTGGFTVMFFVRKLASIVSVSAVKFDHQGQIIEIKDTDGPERRILVYDQDDNVTEVFDEDDIDPNAKDVTIYGVDPDTIEGYPVVISRAPWDFVFMEYYSNAKLQGLEINSRYRLAVVGLETTGQLRNGLPTNFTYEVTEPISELIEYQFISSDEGSAFIVYNKDGLRLMKVNPDGSRQEVLVDEFGQTPSLAIFQKVEEFEVFDVVVVSYIRKQTGFVSMSTRVNVQFRAETLECIHNDNCRITEYYYLDTQTSIFRPRLTITSDNVYVVYKRQDNRIYIDKLNKLDNEYVLIRQIDEDFTTLDPIDLKIRGFDTNVSILYNHNLETRLRRFDVQLQELWNVGLETSFKPILTEEEDGIFVGYRNMSMEYKVVKFLKDTGSVDWTSDILLTNVVGNRVNNLFILFGFPIMFNVLNDGNVSTTKLFPEGSLVSQRLTSLAGLDTTHIVDYPVVLSQIPWKSVYLGYYTTEVTNPDIIVVAPGLGIDVCRYEAPIDFQLPTPLAEISANQVLQLGSLVYHVHTDEPNKLLVTKHQLVTGEILSSFLDEGDGGYPFGAVLGYRDGRVYLSYLKYEITFTEIIELVIWILDAETLSPVREVVRRVLPDPDPSTFRPRIALTGSGLLREYVRYNNEIYFEKFNPNNLLLERPFRTGIDYSDRDPLKIHFFTEGLDKLLLLYPNSDTETTYTVSKLFVDTLTTVWSNPSVDGGDQLERKAHPDVRFDLGSYYLSLSAETKGLLIKFSDQDGSVTWFRNIPVKTYSFSGYSSGNNINIEVPVGAILQFVVNTPGQPLWFKTRRIAGTTFPVLFNVENNGSDQNTITWNTDSASLGEYYYISELDELMFGKITLTEAPLGYVPETLVWNVTQGGIDQSRYNQGMVIFEHFPMVYTIPGSNYMTVTKFSDMGVKVSNRTTLLNNFDFNTEVVQGSTYYSASILPWNKMLIFHKTPLSSLSYTGSRLLSARTLDSGVADILPEVSLDIRRSQGMYDGNFTARVVMYEKATETLQVPTGTSVYYFNGRRPLDQFRRVLIPTGFKPSLTKMDSEEEFYMSYIRAIETFTEVQYIGMRSLTADVSMKDVWIAEEEIFPDGQYEHFRPLIKKYPERNFLVYVRQSGQLVIESRSLEDGSIIQRVTTSNIVPNPEELVIGGDYELFIGYPNGDDTVTLLRFNISDIRRGIVQGWPSALVTDLGVPGKQKRSLEVLQTVSEALMVAFLAYDEFSNEQLLYHSSIDEEAASVNWTARAETSDFDGRFQVSERIAGFTYDGSFVGTTKLGRTLIDVDPTTIDAFTYSINSIGSRVREIKDRFADTLPEYQGNPLFMLSMADEFGILAMISFNGKFQMFRVFSTGGSVRVPYDGLGRAQHAAYPDEDWWRPLITINPILQGSELEENVILNVIDAEWAAVIWTGNNFVAVGPSRNAERVMVSSTGRTWTGIEMLPEFDKDWINMVWAQGALNMAPYAIVAIAKTEDGNSVMTTTDAINWTLRTTPGGDYEWSGLVWNEQLLVATATAGSGQRVMISGIKPLIGQPPDGDTVVPTLESEDIAGIDWTTENVELLEDLNESSWKSVAWSLDQRLFVAVASNGPYKLMKSSDGCSWMKPEGDVDPLINETSWVSVIWATMEMDGSGLFVAVSPQEGRIAVSPDGDTWNIYQTNFMEEVTSIAWSRLLNMFVMVAKSGQQRIATSPDAVHWTVRGTPEQYDAFLDLAIENDFAGTGKLSIPLMRRILKEVHMNVGKGGITSGNVGFLDIAVDSSDKPYVAYQDFFSLGRLEIQRFSTNVWQQIGEDVSESSAEHIVTVIDSSDFPWVAYRDTDSSSKLTVVKYNGVSWEVVGTPGFSEGAVRFISAVFDSNGNLYLGYQDEAYGSRLVVQKYDGVSWEVVGTPGFSEGVASYTSMVVDRDNVPYIAFSDQGGSLAGRAVVMKLIGSVWLPMGGSSISAGQASFINLRIDNRTEQQLYIAYRDEALQGYADVRNFSAEFNQWVYFNSGSNDPITLSAVENLCLVIDSNNNLVMAYRDPSVNGGLTMFKYNVNTVSERFWKLIDRRGISSGGVSNLKMAAGLDGKVYLAFSDLSKNGRLTVSGIYPDNVDHIVLAVENMLKESTPFNETTIGYVDFANANYSPAPNNWSSVIWSSGAIGPGEIGTFMAVSSSSSVDNSIIVYNLPAVLTIREFNAVFSSYGTITYSRIFTNRKTQLSEGFGIVTYQNRSSALNAIKPLSQGGRNGFLLKGQALFIENGVPDRAVSSYTGVVWTMRQTIRDVGAGSYQAWFSNGHPKFEKRYDFDGEITAVERYYSKDGQWSKEIEHIGLSRIREFLLPTKINIYEVYRRFFDTNDDELIDREELLCGIRSFNLNVPDLPVGSSPLDMVFNRMMPNNSGLVDFKGFARVLPNDVYTRDIANNIGFDRAILVRDAESTNGLKDGIMTEYESSLPKYMLVRTANFKMDVLNGMEMTYYTDSSLRSEVNYVNGRRVGMYREYYPREYGILRPKLFQEYDERGYETPVKSTFYPSGDTQPDPEYIAERFVDERDPKIKIRVRTFWPGAIPRSIYYTTETNIKTGLYIEYGITGALVQTGTYDQNRKLGRWETIFETPRFYIVSGAKRVLENYVQGKLSGVNAVQVFNEAGIRIFVRSYPNVV